MEHTHLSYSIYMLAITYVNIRYYINILHAVLLLNLNLYTAAGKLTIVSLVIHVLELFLTHAWLCIYRKFGDIQIIFTTEQ